MTNATLISPADIFMYFTVFPLMVILGIFLLVFLAIMWFLWVPPEAKVYTINKLNKQIMLDYETEDGIRHLETAKAYTEGILVGNKTKNVYFLPRPISNEAVKKLLQQENITEDEIQKVVDNIRDMETKTLRAGIVSSLGCRIYRAYQSKAVATTLNTLVGLEHSGEDKTIPMVLPAITTTDKILKKVKLKSTSKKDELIQKINEKLETGQNIIRVLLPVDPALVQKFFNAQYTQSQQRARDRISEAIGASEEKGYWKKVLAFCGILVTILIISFVAMMVLK